MRNAGKRFENLKFRKKLILVFGLSLIFSLTLSLFMLASYFISVLRQNARSNLRLLTLQVTDNFERRLSDTESQLFNMINMFQIPSYMGRMDAQRDSYGRRELTYMANQLVSAVSPFDFIYLETDGGYSADTREKLRGEREETLEFAKSLVVGQTGDMKSGYRWASDGSGHVYILHSVRNISSLKHEGYVAARVKRSSLDLLRSENREDGSFFLFYNEDKSCIYLGDLEKDLGERIKAQILAGQGLEGNQSWGHTSYYVSEQRAGDWHVAGITPMSVIENMRRSVIVIGVLAGLLSLLLGSVLMRWLTRKISLQLEVLTNSINQVSEGGLGTMAPVYSHDDIGELTEHFNAMNRRISALLNRVVQEERLKNKANMEALEYRYRFLQTQINPHFIYNALETVNAIAKINKAPEISKVIQLIGRYFRGITANSDKQFVPLKDAFESIKVYIEIYHYVQENRLLTEIGYPEELGGVKIPTMILQPIVENCFVHGMPSGNALFVIRINARDCGGKLCITIEDNGKGAEAGKNCVQAQRKGAHTGIGLANITERLALLYGDQGSMTMESSSFGTTVTIWIPLIKNQMADAKN